MLTTWAPPVVHVTEGGTCVVQGVEVTEPAALAQMRLPDYEIGVEVSRTALLALWEENAPDREGGADTAGRGSRSDANGHGVRPTGHVGRAVGPAPPKRADTMAGCASVRDRPRPRATPPGEPTP
ncbi:hypothetical protein NKH77_20970 [Streptomyces sp. M19]